jgi:tetratricopeptide (TPR) repeat protein
MTELELAREHGGYAPVWKSTHARALAREGRIEQALAEAREAADAVDGSDNISGRAGILVDLAEVLRASGDHSGAADALELAVRLHEEKGNVVNAEQCRQLLANVPATDAGA